MRNTGRSGFRKIHELGRRDVVRIGFCAALGLGLPDLMRHEARSVATPDTFPEGKAKSRRQSFPPARRRSSLGAIATATLLRGKATPGT